MTGKLRGESVPSPLLAAGDHQEYPTPWSTAQKSPLPVFTSVLLFSLVPCLSSFLSGHLSLAFGPGNEGQLHLGLVTSTDTFP